MKKCHRCKKALPEENFAPRGEGLRSVCRACQSLERKRARANVANIIMPVVFELLTQYGPMRARTIIDMLKTQHNIPTTAQRLYQSLPLWEHAHRITIDKRGTVFVYRIVGDSRPVFAPQSAPKPQPEKLPVVDAAEMDAWFESLKKEVIERQSQREAMRHG